MLTRPQFCKDGVYDEAMSTFFENVDARRSPPAPLSVGSPVRSLRARALLVDLEEGVVSRTLRSPLGELFAHNQFITDNPGAGNNW